MKKHILLFCILLWGTGMTQYETNNDSATPAFPWPDGKKCALSLTFDDARLSQIDKGIPLLNQFGIKATFYISPENLQQRLEGWKQAVANGHEIGNHTNTHPCTGNYAFSRDNALEDYDLDKIASDIDQANDFILTELGIQTQSFAYPCGQKFVGRDDDVQSYVPLISERFLSGRGWLGEDSNDPWLCDFSQLLGMESDGKSFEDLKNLLDKAVAEGRWLVLAGHEMDDGGRQTTLLSSLEELCRYAQDPQNGIWIDTVANIATYIKENREAK